MTESKIYPLNVLPGVKKDGTEFEGNYYTNSLWCRYQRGKPRKIGGYKNLLNQFSGPVRGCYMDSRNGLNYVFAGSSGAFEMFIMDNDGSGGGITDRTPAGFTIDAENSWQFDSLYDTGSNTKQIIAHAAPNLNEIDNATEGEIYTGDANDSALLTGTGLSVSGGVVVLPPYVFGFGNDGSVFWTAPNTTDFNASGSGNARIAPNKVVRGMRTRGGSGYSPAGLFWTLDELYRAYFVGGSTIWNFDIISETAIMSPPSAVEYNGRYYWPDKNRFCIYNGAVEDLPNDMNTNYFYNNVNRSAWQKVWGTKIPQYNEIWWFWPKGSATECTDVLIYNVKDKIWYDTTWASDQAARSCGIYAKFFPYPLMFGLDATATDKYSLWQHEYGVDRLENGTNNAIRSNFTTCDISFCADLGSNGWVGEDRWVNLMRIEPDFVQSGGMSVIIEGRKYAQTDSVSSDPYDFTSSTGKIDMKEQRREMRLTFESNEAGGNYQLGQTLLHMQIGDGRQ